MMISTSGEGRGDGLRMEMETFWPQEHSHKIIFPKRSGKVRFLYFYARQGRQNAQFLAVAN